MMSNEDKILEDAVKIASSRPMLSRTDMIDVIIQSTGVSEAIAEKALQQASSSNRQQHKAKVKPLDRSDSNNTQKLKNILIVVGMNITMMVVAYNVVIPVLIGDRNLLDVLQDSGEILE